MSSGSVRLHIQHNPHAHEEPPVVPSAGDAPPDPRGAGAEADPEPKPAGELWREGGKVLYRQAEGGEPAAVRLVWARPLSGRGGPVSVLLANKKKEIAYLPSLDSLSEQSRRVALEELDMSMVMPRINSVVEVKPRFGNYYWTVDTDRGRRVFLLSAPENNTYRPSPDVVVIRDVSGNCYEINPISALDKHSLREMDRAL